MTVAAMRNPTTSRVNWIPVLIQCIALIQGALSLEQDFWAFTRTWPMPVPVHNESYIFPQFYSTSCKFGVLCRARDKISHARAGYNATKLSLAGTLCFTKHANFTDCIKIQQSVLSAFEDPLRNLESGISMYPASLNESKVLSKYLSGNWSRNFEQLQANFSIKILALNDTKVDLITLGEFSDWMVRTFSYFKEWIGVGMFGFVLLAGLGLTLFLLCRLRTVRKREKVAIARALSALEAGQSPQAWISILQDS